MVELTMGVVLLPTLERGTLTHGLTRDLTILIQPVSI